MSFVTIVGWTVTALALMGGLYALAAAFLAPRVLARPRDRLPDPLPAVTVLKPLHGHEPGLETALTSFLAQDYPAPVQVVFGLRDASDPARAVVERLKARFPERDIVLVVDPNLHGTNGKISNLINMFPATTSDIVVLADSDITVPRGYLKAVVAALSRPGIGVVSCLYNGSSGGGLWSRLGAMGISYHFLPNAVFGIATGMAHPSFGSTIALSRETLAAIGGFTAFADVLADDYEIGRAVRAHGLGIAYPPLAVSHNCLEESAGALIRHELRWARTIRVIDPAGHWGSFVTHALTLGLIGAAVLGFNPWACVAFATILVTRLFLKAQIDHIVEHSAGPLWLLPLRDVLSFGLFIASLFGDAVEWRGHRLRVRRSGAMFRS